MAKILAKNSGKINQKTLFLVSLFVVLNLIAIFIFISNSPEKITPLPNPKQEQIKLAGQPIKNNFQARQSPEIRIKTKLSAADLKERISFLNSLGETINLDFDIQENGEEKIIKILPTPEFKPGKYILKIKKITGIDFSQDFTWGVLAINTNQSSYLPGETAEIYMTVLDDLGKTVCDAEVNLTITSPSGNKSYFSTKNGSITKSPECQPKNFTYKPDFQALFKIPEEEGVYLLDLVSEIKNQKREMVTSLLVSQNQTFIVYRSGPVRLYPPSTYEMKIKIIAKKDFDGKIEEKTPLNFQISQISGFGIVEEKTQSAKTKSILWKRKFQKGEEVNLSYSFKAPDISPEFYLLGPLSLIQEEKTIFEEPNPWQLAADQTSHMILFFDGSTIPSGWTCISCASGDAFYQLFPRGNSSYGGTGGAASHSHSFSGTHSSCYCAFCKGTTSGYTNAACSHSHNMASGYTSAASNLPSYRELKLIRYDSGIPSQIPQGSIAVFTSSVPSGFTRYSSQDNYFIRGSGSPGTTGGANNHTHSFTVDTTPGTSSNVIASGGTSYSRPYYNHDHDNVTVNTPSASNLPPYITIILGQADNNTDLPDGLVSLFDGAPEGSWTILSNSGGVFFEKFLLASSSYGTTGGATNHGHSSMSVSSGGVSTFQSNSVENTGTNVCIGGYNQHTHTFNVNFGSADNLPPYKDVIIAQYTLPSPTPTPTNTPTPTPTPTNTPTPTPTLPPGIQFDGVQMEGVKINLLPKLFRQFVAFIHSLVRLLNLNYARAAN